MIVRCPSTNEARQAHVDDLIKLGGVFIHPSNDPDVMSGQGTVGMEILEQFKDQFADRKIDAVVVPIGGGGICSGVAMAVKVGDILFPSYTMIPITTYLFHLI